MAEQINITPGPWKIHGNVVMQDKGVKFNNWYTPETHCVAIVSQPHNRQLIALAPEMLMLCEMLEASDRLASDPHSEADEEQAAETLDRAVELARNLLAQLRKEAQ